jgi:hypothetical protein
LLFKFYRRWVGPAATYYLNFLATARRPYEDAQSCVLP